MSYKTATKADIDAAIKRAVAPELERIEQLASEMSSALKQARHDHGVAMNRCMNLEHKVSLLEERNRALRASILREFAKWEQRHAK